VTSTSLSFQALAQLLTNSGSGPNSAAFGSMVGGIN